MKTTKLLICAISLVAALTASKSSAQNLSATLIEISPGLEVKGTLNDGASINDYRSGVNRFTEFDAFCVDPTQDLAYGENLIYQVQSSGSLANATQIAKLVGGFLDSSKSNLEAAAVQWAIWEITTEKISAPSLLDGNVRIIRPDSQAAADLADQYLSKIDTYTPVALTYLTHSGRQDVVTWNIPEPGTLALAAFSSLLLLRRRR